MKYLKEYNQIDFEDWQEEEFDDDIDFQNKKYFWYVNIAKGTLNEFANGGMYRDLISDEDEPFIDKILGLINYNKNTLDTNYLLSIKYTYRPDSGWMPIDGYDGGNFFRGYGEKYYLKNGCEYLGDIHDWFYKRYKIHENLDIDFNMEEWEDEELDFYTIPAKKMNENIRVNFHEEDWDETEPDEKSEIISYIKQKVDKNNGGLSMYDLSADSSPVYIDQFSIWLIKMLYNNYVLVIQYGGYKFQEEIVSFNVPYENLNIVTLKEIKELIDNSLFNENLNIDDIQWEENKPKMERKKEGWVSFTRFYCKKGYIDVWVGDSVDDPNKENQKNFADHGRILPTIYSVNSMATFYRLNDGKWVDGYEFKKNFIADIRRYKDYFTSNEIWEENKL
jgi:hypothetical protein